MNHFLRSSSLLMLLFCTFYLQGQPQFFLNGSATENDSCFQITIAENWLVGSIWNEEKINLNESFEVAVDLFVGCKDEDGADGIVFGLQPISTSIGTPGGDMGFGGVTPSIGIEFDTYQNVDYDDPTFDHITIIRDGEVRHNMPGGTLAGPIQANIDNENIEDCEYHYMVTTWDAEIQTLSVFLDCELRLTYTGDIVNEIFNGDPEVFWGFTSATGGLNNIHEICFTYTSLLDDLVDQTICPGASIQLEASGGVSYSWTPSEGLSDPAIANPIATPAETTLYTVEILDECGIPFYNEVLITIEENQFDLEITSTPNNLVDILPGTEFSLDVQVIPSSGEDYTYFWASVSGSTFSDPNASSTTVTSSVSQTGTETITIQIVTEEGCTEEASISFDIQGSLYDIPNAFTPNGDSINDAFGVITGAEVQDFNCKIFNRWGEVVFESDDQSNFWDGTYKEKAVTADVYIYSINMEIGGVQFEEKGDLTLIR